jgi:hypothetical protein
MMDASRFQKRSVVRGPDMRLEEKEKEERRGRSWKGCNSAWAVVAKALKLMSNVFSWVRVLTERGT